MVDADGRLRGHDRIAEQLREVRAIVGDMPFLVPGVGARTVEQLDNSLDALERRDFTDAELDRIDDHAVDGGVNWWAESAEG